jgi:hypothetical protein
LASYNPPTENLPIFDDSVFTGGDTPLTYNIAIKKFLRYPSAQGDETLAGITVDGSAVFNNSILAIGTNTINGSTTFGGVINANNSSTFSAAVSMNSSCTFATQPPTCVKGLYLRDATLNTNSLWTNLTNVTRLLTASGNIIAFSPGGASVNPIQMNATNMLNSYVMPALGNSSTIVPTTAWVTSSIAAIPPPTTMSITTNYANTNCSLLFATPIVNGSAAYTLNSTINAPLYINPFTNTIGATTFSGALYGNASTSTSTGNILTTTGTTQLLYLAGATNFALTSQQLYLGALTYYTYTGLLTTPAITAVTSNVTGPLLAVTDNSTSVATTAWVQSTVAPIRNFLYQQPAPYSANSGLAKDFITISGIPNSYFTQVTGVIPPSFKFHLSITTASTDYANIFSYFADLDIYPSRMTNQNPPTSGSPQSAGGGVVFGYNANNAVNGNTTYGVIDPIYAPYGRWYWSSNPAQGMESGGATTFVFYNCSWQNISPNNTTLTIGLIFPSTRSSVTTLSPTSGYPFGVNAQINYNINYLGSNIILNSGGTVLLF